MIRQGIAAFRQRPSHPPGALTRGFIAALLITPPFGKSRSLFVPFHFSFTFRERAQPSSLLPRSAIHSLARRQCQRAARTSSFLIKLRNGPPGTLVSPASCLRHHPASAIKIPRSLSERTSQGRYSPQRPQKYPRGIAGRFFFFCRLAGGFLPQSAGAFL